MNGKPKFFVRVDKFHKKKIKNAPTQYDSYELGWVQFKNIEVGLKKILEKKKKNPQIQSNTNLTHP